MLAHLIFVLFPPPPPPPPFSLSQDHDVAQDHILLVSLLSAQLGVHSIAYVYPEVKIITSAMDKMVNEHYHIIPGVGNYGDRYFGTESDDYVA